VILEDENFEGPGSESGWTSGTTANAPGLSQFLGRLGSGSEEMSKSFSVPRGLGQEKMKADRVSIDFALYQIDDWSPSDKFFVEINGVVIDLGEMSPTSSSVDLSGVESGITWARQTVSQGTNLGFGVQLDKKHKVQLSIPASVFPGESILLKFRVVTSQGIESESAGVDDLVTKAYYDCAKASPTTAAPITAGPTVAPGSPSASPTSGAPITAGPTPGPTVAPGWIARYHHNQSMDSEK